MLTSIDRTIRYRSLVTMRDRSQDEYYEALDSILRYYNAAGYRVVRIHCDREFKSIMDEVKDEMDIDMNYANTGDHQPEAERNNRTIKERIRAAYHRLPFKCIPRIMIEILAVRETAKLNYFPAKGGVSSYYSPHMLLSARNLDYTKHFLVPFGTYVQASHEPVKKNTLESRTIDGIYLQPSKNLQGGHEIMSLHSREALSQPRVTLIPMPDLVKKRVKQLARKQGIKSLKFTNR